MIRFDARRKTNSVSDTTVVLEVCFNICGPARPGQMAPEPDAENTTRVGRCQPNRLCNMGSTALSYDAGGGTWGVARVLLRQE